MPKPRAPLGDSHNFGRRVSFRGSRVAKPRALLWEWLVLSAESTLRRLLVELARKDGLGHDAFDFLPALRFFGVSSLDRGAVEQLDLTPLGRPSARARRALATAGGRALALFSWLGAVDLHWENLALGRGKRGEVVFGPLDVEMLLSDLSLPTETKLLPDADPEYAAVCRHACGVRRLLPYLGKPIEPEHLLTMAGAYIQLLAFLERHGAAIARVIARQPGLKTAPIRVCLRGTGDYVLSRVEPIWPPLLDAELEQLERGDIPYFFRLYGQPGIRYYADASLRRIRTLPTRGDMPRLEALLSLTRGLRSPARRKLRQEGLFTLLAAFDDPGFSGRHQSAGLAVTFGARTFSVELPSGDVLRSRRNLGAVVGSVYSPCRCGEVRSVLVPAITRCESA